ncbi:SCO2400 family protein [Streptomyces sp. AHA2]|uniref:SCO2400 family protein n=1 Tax=Streptomyces sp. AHA2 TaxID=3064526 RepID=UPI002FE3C827
MDYCSSCRRHLNGALVCPGCGAYAPDIDPCGIDGRTPARSTVPTAWRTAAGPRYTTDRDLMAPGPGEPAGLDPEAGENPAPSEAPGVPGPGAIEGSVGRPQGRAARRRQMARWKKNQRRAVVATAVALVGGGLTVAAVNGNATPGVQAATTPDNSPMGGTGAQAPDSTAPAADRYGTPRSAPGTAPQSPRASRHQQTRAADPRTTPAGTRTDAATAPRELPLTTPGRAGTSVPDTTGSAQGDAGNTTPAATAPVTPPAAGTDTQQPGSPATPPPAADHTDPAAPPADSGSGSGSGSGSRSDELCLLVICLG